MRRPLSVSLGCAGLLLACGQPFTATADAGADGATIDANADGPSNGNCPGKDLGTDSENCGACGHSCRGGACSGGLCPAVVLAKNLVNPRELAVAGPGSVYFTVGGSCDAAGDCKNGVLEHVAATASSATVSIIDQGPNGLGLDQIDAVAVGLAGDVFYSTAAQVGGQIFRYAPTNQTHQLFIDQQQAPVALAADANSLYWADAVGSIWAADLGSRLPVEQANDNLGKVPSAVAVEPQSHTLFWANVHDDTTAGPQAINGSLHQVSGATSPGPDYALYQPLAGPTGVAYAGGNLFWTESLGGTVAMGAPMGGQLSPKTIAKNQGTPYRIAAAAQTVYWTNSGDGTVVELLLDGSSPPLPLASGQSNPSAVGSDDTSVYWLNRGTNNQPDGALLRVPK